MKTPVRIALPAILLAAVFLAACAPAASPATEEFYPMPAATQGLMSDASTDAFAAQSAGGGEAKAPAGAAELNPNAVVESGNTTLPDVPQPQSDHMIIKNADVNGVSMLCCL